MTGAVGALALGVALAGGCRTAGAPTGGPVAAATAAPITAPPATAALASLFDAGTVRWLAVRTDWTYDEGESESKTAWMITCTQTPVTAMAATRRAAWNCEAGPSYLVDEDPDPRTAFAPDEEGATGTTGSAEDLEVTWLATARGLWIDHSELTEAELTTAPPWLTWPPVARADEIIDPDSERDPPGREAHEIRQAADGAWCVTDTSEPGGGSDASYASYCFADGRLVRGTRGDGHGAHVWERTFTRMDDGAP